jgi:catechol 2,3-dioxygenase-like lactoylglutathione lyase family enzyme
MLDKAHLMAFVPSTDLDRSREFYAGALGLELVETTPFACVLRSGGTTLRVTRVEELRPQPFTVLGWEVPDLRAALAALPVPVLRFPGLGQDDDGVWTTPGGDRIAWFADPDGNTLSLTQFAAPDR